MDKFVAINRYGKIRIFKVNLIRETKCFYILNEGERDGKVIEERVSKKKILHDFFELAQEEATKMAIEKIYSLEATISITKKDKEEITKLKEEDLQQARFFHL